MVMAEPPTQEDVNVYAALCKTGSLSKYDVSAEAGLISRRVLSGAAKLSAASLKDEFPGIKEEKNRLILIQGLQDCVYRYVERFHPQIAPKATPASPPPQLAPSIPPERRREIVFLANQIEDFKKIMEKTKEEVPERYYDARDTTEKFPKKDTNLLDLENYNRCKAFQTPSGIPDFSNVTKNDVAIICNTFSTEVKSYYKFRNSWSRVIALPGYQISNEVQRICNAARR
jgi:hypothetical protein